MVGDASDAEKKFKAFDYKAMYGGSEENMHKYFDEFTNILSHLSVSRQGDPEEWVEFLSEELPDDLATEYCSKSHRGGVPSDSEELRYREHTHCGLIIVISR